MRQGVEDAIAQIASAHGGRVTPEQVVAAAKPAKSPLHPYFTWNVQEAAEQHWLEQARQLIRSVRLEITTTFHTIKAPAYVRDPTVAAHQQGFATVARLRTDEDAAREAVVNEFSRASSALTRAKHVAVALGMADEIEEVRERILQLTERASQEGMPATASA